MNNDTFSFDVSNEIIKIREATHTTEISKISKISNAPTGTTTSSNEALCKIKVINNLIYRYAKHYGESEENIMQYIDEQLKTYSLNDLMKCFKSLNANIRERQISLSKTANLANPQKQVSCSSCLHFTPDHVGSGTGIGICHLGVIWTHENNGRMPLYRYADRHCEKYSKPME